MTMPARHCKVIATGFADRRHQPGLYRRSRRTVRENAVFSDPEMVLALIDEIVRREKQIDPGAACDTILVNNDVGWRTGNRRLRELDGSRLHAGRLRVMNRPNYGEQFGAFDAAFDAFDRDYDYWLFTPDWTIVGGDRYFAALIERYDDRPGCGFLSLSGLSTEGAHHAHDGAGLTRANVLAEVRSRWGHLPCVLDASHDSEESFVWGEVMFTHMIERVGHTLECAPGDLSLCEWGSEVIRRPRGSIGTARIVPRLTRQWLWATSRLATRWVRNIEARQLRMARRGGTSASTPRP